MANRVSLPLLVEETLLPTPLPKLLEPQRLKSSYMPLPFLSCCPGPTAAFGHRQHQERKLKMLTHWRDAAERQLAALNAAISTLQQQMERDGRSEAPGSAAGS